MSSTILQGDCIKRMAEMEEASVDAIVCDPPYGLGFMGKKWDDLPPGLDFALEALRVLKPGGHLLAFGGTRTYHRLACAIEDAGFEIRDSLLWLYGSGFPKSLDVSKAIDKAAGAEREVVGQKMYAGGHVQQSSSDKLAPPIGTFKRTQDRRDETAPATPEAAQWEGWGTALKPAHEPIVVARKPLIGTVAANVLEHGTGGLNIDACRIGDSKRVPGGLSRTNGNSLSGSVDGSLRRETGEEGGHDQNVGRFPANVVLSHTEDCNGECAPGCPAAELDLQSGRLQSGSRAAGVRTGMGYGGANGDGGPATVGDSGGASRFFYQAKTSRAERNAGLEGFEEKPASDRFRGERKSTLSDPRMDREQERRPAANNHPTVKPINLMRWLVRLVTPPGGTILDPFLGSGTTGCAAALEGFDFVGIEREPEYIAIAEARIAFWAQQEGRETKDVLKASKKRKAPDPTQPELLEAA